MNTPNEDCLKIAQLLRIPPEVVAETMAEVARADRVTPEEAAQICAESLHNHGEHS